MVTGAWWDLVDDVATHLVGPLLLAHPRPVRPDVRGLGDRRGPVAAPDGDDLPARRQGANRRRPAGDGVEANLDDRDFFLRKAIGWALRQHARTDPDWVRAFVEATRDQLSGLSRREALKHLGPA